MNVVFVLDSSASMLQRTPQNLTYLDAAKMAIDNFLKVCCTATREQERGEGKA